MPFPGAVSILLTIAPREGRSAKKWCNCQRSPSSAEVRLARERAFLDCKDEQRGGVCIVQLVDKVPFRSGYFEWPSYGAEAGKGGFGDWAELPEDFTNLSKMSMYGRPVTKEVEDAKRLNFGL